MRKVIKNVRIVLKNGTPFVIASIFIILSFYLLNNVTIIPKPIFQSFSYITFTIMMILLCFSFGFNKLRAFYIGVILLLFYLVTTVEASVANIQYISVILPVNIAMIFIARDGAVLSIQGKFLGIFFIIQAIFMYVFSHDTIEFLQKVIHFSLPFEMNILAIPDVSFVLFFILAIWLTISYLITYSIEKIFFIGSILGILMSLNFSGNEYGLEIFLSASGILLLLSVIYKTYSMAYVDELTNIPSRRMLREDLAKLGSKYSIAMLDIDFFKKFNDKYGHDVGDDVLKLVASCLERVTGGGKAYRYGGEEFTIVFPKKDIGAVFSHLEELREKVSKTEYLYKKDNKNGPSKVQKLRVTISIGIAEKSSANKSTDDVMKAADKALYRAKKKGRNCVSK